MEKKYAHTGLTLNEIIEKMEELRLSLIGYHPTMMSIVKSQQWASNQEKHYLRLRFNVGGWLIHDDKLTKDQCDLVRQGFEVIEVIVWAYWGGNHYGGEPVEGTVYTSLIVDRRGRWDAGSYDHLDFNDLECKLRELLVEQ